MKRPRSVQQAIARAEALLPGTPSREGEADPRWQAIIEVGRFVETQPDHVWRFAVRWGKHAQKDLRAAVATCLVEHLLECHFSLLFDRLRQEAKASVRFAQVFMMCWSLGQATKRPNVARINRLRRELRGRGIKIPH